MGEAQRFPIYPLSPYTIASPLSTSPTRVKDLLHLMHLWASLVVQMAKHLPAMQETQVQSLGWEDPLEKGMASHSSILAWRIPRTEKPGGLESIESLRVGHD